MFYPPPQKKKKICFIDDVHEIKNQSCCILSGPPCILSAGNQWKGHHSRQIFHHWHLKAKSSPGWFNRKSKKFQTEQWKLHQNWMKNKEDMKLWSFIIFQQNISWTVDMNIQMSELMMSSPHFSPHILYIKFFTIFSFLLKHVKACPLIKIYQSKHYSAFPQCGYTASLTFS